MFELLRSPFRSTFKAFAESIRHDCLICSPYITLAPIKMLSQTLSANQLAEHVHINLVTDISLRTVLQKATDISALLYLLGNHPNATITYLPRIHAKVYVADGTSAIITSANFTEGGEIRNFEYGVKVNDLGAVEKIRADINQYKALGAIVTASELRELQAQVENLADSIQTEQKAIAKKIREESKNRQVMVEENLLRLRVKGKSIHAIFSDTILYLLSQKSMRTEELHHHIRNIHPDLCDDRFDRVIDGKHFGKLWKHQVRNAQVYLRRSHLIVYDHQMRVWHLPQTSI